MRIAENIELLAVPINVPDVDATMHMTLMWDDENLVLMDASIPGQAEEIAKAIADAGFDAKNLTHIIITHQDMDHIGSVLDMQKMAPNAKILAHHEEAPYMDGRKMPIRLATNLAKYDDLPPEVKEYVDQAKADYEVGKFKLKIDQELTDKEVLPICGGIEIVHTPGHMPGHIALFLQKSGIMVCGDAANIADGKMTGPNPVHTPDIETGMQSLEKMKQYPLTGIVAYHGGYLQIK